MDQRWSNRAASAEAAVTTRHLDRLWHLPGTQLGVVGWPSTGKDRAFGTWHYWWQAHLLDTLIDAQLRDPRPERVTRIRRQIRGHHLRNIGRWTNSYYDDMAWLALALERAGRLVGVNRHGALATLGRQLLGAWMPELGGGIPWRKQDRFFNAPANGPAGIFLARYHSPHRAQETADWIESTLIDPETHLVFDGIKAGSLVRAQYTYCQGVVVGLETELAVRTGEDRHRARVARLVAAIGEHMTHGGVLRGAGEVTAGCSPGSPHGIWHWRPSHCPATRPPTPPLATPPRTSCWPRPARLGRTGRVWTDCRCSGRSGTGHRRSRARVRRPENASAARSPNRPPPSATSRSRCRAGC